MKLLSLKKIMLLMFYTVNFLFFSNINAQIIYESGSLFNKVSDFISNIPGSTGSDYKQPLNTDINKWNTIISDLTNTNYNSAVTNANSLGYNLIEFSDTTTSPQQVYYILSPNSLNHWGFYVFNPNYCRSLVIQSPHPEYDYNTGKQGIHVFKETNALFFCLSGTHRCNSSEFSSCSGTTSVCSEKAQKFKISDLAHNDNSIFQETTQVLFNTFDDSYFIQLHGFEHELDEPYLILSNGTQITPTNDYLVDFKDAILIEDNTLTAVVAHINLDWDSLRGFTNTQGRMINQSADICNLNATSTNGRFFHIEQEKTKLRNDISGWTKVSNAIKSTFSCQAILSTKDNKLRNNLLNIYPNPTDNKLTIISTRKELEEINIFNVLGKNISKSIGIIKLEETKMLIDMTKLPAGLYFVKSMNTTNKVYKK